MTTFPDHLRALAARMIDLASHPHAAIPVEAALDGLAAELDAVGEPAAEPPAP